MIRLLTTADAPIYRTLRLKALQTDPDAYQSTYELESTQPLNSFSHQIAEAIHPPIFGYYGYFIENNLVGYIQIEYPTSPKRQHSAKLINLYVDPDVRGRHIGQQLFDKVTRLAQQAGLEQLHLSCAASNTHAQALYATQGFVEYGRKKAGLKWQGKYDDVVMLAKNL